MAGKRLLDLAALFNASRGVAEKHLALRSRQWDVYNRTSTVARAVRSQTDRVTETAKAASFLASRLNESGPVWASQSRDDEIEGRSNEADPTLDGSDTSVDNDGPLPTPSNTPSARATKGKPLSSNAAKALQRQFEFQIPSQAADGASELPVDPLGKGHDADIFYQKSGHTSPALSSLPRVKIPKHPSSSQGSIGDSSTIGINSDSFYSNGGPGEQASSIDAAPEQEQIPEGVNTDVFHSRRVAKILSGKVERGVGAPSLGLNSSNNILLNHGLAADGEQDMADTSAPPATQPESLHTISSEPRVKSSESPANSDANTPWDGLHSVPYELRESKVPSSRLGRLWNYGGLAAGMFGGVVSEGLRRVSGNGGEGSYILSAGNMDRLVSKLSRMRGAALKLGQVMSFQDSKMLPAPIQEVLQRVQDRADYMPASQRNKVLAANLGSEWRDIFSNFDEMPMAAASIGQVHSATLKSTGARVAVKVQYPGVADSIDSDLNNLAILLTASRLLPKGMFLDRTIANARTELAWECDYVREAEGGRRFKELLADDTDIFVVPEVYPEASGKQVLTMEFMDGIAVTRVQNFSQEQKDWIGTQILRLCLREIMEFKYMQTDPNWTNFLYNAKTNKLELLDFGASREYPDEFILTYSRLLAAASRSDKETVKNLSLELGYLTGHESQAMLSAHIASVLTLAEPFVDSSPELYDFRDQTITERVKSLIPVMIRERLAPPPEETYSLHRKLSGAFLLCAKLGSRVPCRELFKNSITKAGIL
jgi:aarF domain-containing kinase